MGTKESIPVPDSTIIQGNGQNKWQVAISGNVDDIKTLLDDDWEPFAVCQGKVYFRKK